MAREDTRENLYGSELPPTIIKSTEHNRQAIDALAETIPCYSVYHAVQDKQVELFKKVGMILAGSPEQAPRQMRLLLPELKESQKHLDATTASVTQTIKSILREGINAIDTECANALHPFEEKRDAAIKKIMDEYEADIKPIIDIREQKKTEAIAVINKHLDIYVSNLHNTFSVDLHKITREIKYWCNIEPKLKKK